MDAKIFCVALIAMLCLCGGLFAQIYDEDGLLYELVTIDNVQGWQVSKGITEEAHIIIPPDFAADGSDDTYPVIKIKDYGFADYTPLTQIDFYNCESIVEIGDYAFKNCVNLPGTMFPSRIISLGVGAFSGCTLLNSINVRDTLQYIGDDAFYGCSSLNQIYSNQSNPTTLPSSLTSIGSRSFGYCTSLTQLTIPNSVTSLGGNPFVGCDDDLNIIFAPGNANFSFEGDCIISVPDHRVIAGFDNSVIPDFIEIIGDYAFAGKAIANVVLPVALISIGSFAFADCEAITEIELPNTLVDVGDDAFSGCSSIDTVTVPNRGPTRDDYRNTEIGANVFANCTALTSVTLPESFNYISEGMFKNCTSLADISFSDAIASIGSSAFQNCESLEHIELPITLVDVGDDAFSGCSSIDTVTVPNRSRDGETYRATLGNNVFENCSSLVSVTMPQGFTTISAGMFAGCTSLESVSYLSPLTSIGANAFLGCDVFPRIDIHLSVATIGSNAFAGCDELVIYTAYASRPAGWATDWNPDNRPVNWNALSTTDNTDSVTLTKLVGNYPNPFNPNTSINFVLASPSAVSIEIYNVKGQLVKTLVTDNLPAGSHTVVWNGENANGNAVVSGVYFYKMTASEYLGVRKMVLLK